MRIAAPIIFLVVFFIATVSADDTAVPRCGEDGHSYSVDEHTVTIGTISYNGKSTCTDGTASLSIISEPTGLNSVVQLSEWKYAYGANDQTSSSFEVAALCGSSVVCQATVTYYVKENVDTSFPSCSHSSSHSTYQPGATYEEVLPMDMTDRQCLYTVNLTQPSIGSVSMALLPLHYYYTSSSNSTGSTSFTYRVSCDGIVVCQQTQSVILSADAAAPSASYPLCSNSAKTKNYSVGTTSNDTFPMDVQDGSCSYATILENQPSLGNISSVSGLSYTYDAPKALGDYSNATVAYEVRCGTETVCKDFMTILVAADDNNTANTEYPLCSGANKKMTYVCGMTQSGTFPLAITDGTCSYTVEVTSAPSTGSLVPAQSGLLYTYIPPSSGSACSTMPSTTANYSLYCNGQELCHDTVEFILVDSSLPSSPSDSSSTSQPSEPGSLPSCSKSAEQQSYLVGTVHEGVLPLDVVDSTCTYSSTVSQLGIGVAASMVPSKPLHYIYAADANATLGATSFSYIISCDAVPICSGTVPILLTDVAESCPNSQVSYYVMPGGMVAQTVSTGATCGSSSMSIALKAAVAGLTVSSNGSFVFQAPKEEADVAATMRVTCDGSILCDTAVVFLVASSTVAPPDTTTAPVVPITACPTAFHTKVPTGEAASGQLTQVLNTSCDVKTYLVANSTSNITGSLYVNIVGQYYYVAPNTQRVDYAAVDVYCATEFQCRMPLTFTAYSVLPNASSTTAPLQPCANVYYYEATPGVAINASLNSMPGQDLCAYGRYFSLNTAPAGGSIEMTPIGDFLYRPTAGEGQFYFTFTMYCLNRQYCAGSAYILVSNQWTLSPIPTATPTDPGNTTISNPQISCRGSCNTKAWKTYPSPAMWDVSPDSGYARKDGRPLDGIAIAWQNNSLVIVAYSLIGNLAVRFPSFEPLKSTQGRFMEPSDFTSATAAMSPGPEVSCLANQGRDGLGEDVWRWTTLSYGNGTGGVGAYYKAGSSWYQKFGGKHVNCDTFAASCLYAPMLTPANYTSSSLGKWVIDVDDCDATWTGVFPLSDMKKMKRSDGKPIWKFVGDGQMQGTIYSEAVRASSWLAPGQFDSNYVGHNILINFHQFVSITKQNAAALISVDAELFTYVDNTSNDQAFGINMLIYPYVDSTMKTSYSRDRHVTGFKWLDQQWVSPSMEQCPTCTGSATHCTVPAETTKSSFISSEFPGGNCSSGSSRVQLSKGPSMTTADCAENEMNVYNRSGFSATRNCKTAYQNVTLRGVVPGSSLLTEAELHAFNYEGFIELVLLMDDGSNEKLDVHLSMYASHLERDTNTTTGELSICRSGSYWPVLDPLGTSTAAVPFDLSYTAAEPLCIDDLSSSYGPSDWALFTGNLPGVSPSNVSVTKVFINYNNTRIYLINKDSSTGAMVTPDDGSWWTYDYPFLSFRDLSPSLRSGGSISTSTAMAASTAVKDVAFAFTLIPGSLGVDTEMEVVVVAAATSSSGVTREIQLRRVLHTDPLLTLLSRSGPSAAKTTTSTKSSSDLYAIGATAAVAVVLVLVVVFFMLADNNRPLPKWVPRGKLIKDTVLSVLPAGMRGKKKAKAVVHRDMYDAMKSGRY